MQCECVSDSWPEVHTHEQCSLELSLCVGGSGDGALESLWLLWLYTQKRLNPLSLIPAGQECEQASSVQTGLKPPYILHTIISEASRKGKSFSRKCCKQPPNVALLYVLVCYVLLLCFWLLASALPPAEFQHSLCLTILCLYCV